MSGDFPSAPAINITLNGIKKLLSKLNPNKAAGPDNIKPRILEELSNEIAPILLIIFQKSLETGQVPKDWRNANVTPVYENYRPISHIVTSLVMSHADKNNIIYPLQHSFRRKIM